MPALRPFVCCLTLDSPQVQLKGSHNSLRLSIPLYLQLALDPPDWSCHSVELDLVQSEDGESLGVSHLGTYAYTLSTAMVPDSTRTDVAATPIHSNRIASLQVVLRELKSTYRVETDLLPSQISNSSSSTWHIQPTQCTTGTITSL